MNVQVKHKVFLPTKMRSALYLKASDFFVENNTLLCRNKSFMLIFFHTQEHMVEIRKLREISSSTRNCQIAFLNIEQNPEVKYKASETRNPVTAPMLVFYQDRMPVFKYTGSVDDKEGILGIINVINNRARPAQFVKPVQPPPETAETSLSIPYSSLDHPHLTFERAYGSSQS